MNRQTPVFQMESIRHTYGNRTVLILDSLTIPGGSITGLMGPNGSGKSTLLKLLAFAERPTAGRILFNGRPERPFSEAVRFNITLLTQEPYLLKRSVFDNVAYGLKLRRTTGPIKSRVQEALEYVGLAPDRFAHRKWHQLSGGEAQRAALAARLALKPQVLLLDEPTASVDTKSARLIRDASLLARKEWGTTLVVASHNTGWLSEICDTQLTLFNGRVLTSGMDNILPGPWSEAGGGLVASRLDDGRTILAVKQTGEGLLARIRRRDILLGPAPCAPSQEFENRLNGVVTRMGLEKKSGFVLTVITINGLELSLNLLPEQVTGEELYPGKPVCIRFHPHSVTWI